ncbi:MAG TPA: NAD(P)-dependent oxidoreductase [Flavobacteriaceae bacterium]|nr:MAG: NADP-dependent 3-hydroxy acid dehydrogenase YdfG [Flavobacteriaceae bacterium]HCQ24691.1 NAD(P)-dependent oxidoreductase [Flavobacteriaceae bacterium]|tara:strand:+ start:902 stop:1648 length:747 start_codon:yes stop_codon:yes gene_type:complete
MKTILITGASSGIGWATAEKMSQLGHRIVLCGRREERLLELQKKLKTPTHLCCFDISDRVAVFQNIERLPEAFQPIDVLINNAGNAHGLDLSQEAHLDDWDAMIDSNVKGLLYVTKAILPQMIARQAGQIINIGSIAGKEAYPKGNVYCASKAAVDSFTQGLRLDTNSHGLRIGAIHPGLVETEFSEVRFKGDQQRAELVYNDIEALSAADVAESIAFMIEAPPHVTLADITLLPTDQASAFVINRKS